LSFVILTHNSEKYIARCVDSIMTSIPRGMESEIFVIDNGSRDNTVPILESIKTVHLIKLDKNHGTTFSRNLGLRKCRGEHLVIMDSDVVINRIDWRRALEHFKGRIGLVAPRLMLSNGTVQHNVKRFPTLTSRIRKLKKIFFGIEVRDGELYPDLSAVEYPDIAISAFWIMRRELLDSVGFLDERIFYSPEDVDYCVRIWKKGFVIKYFNDGDTVHFTQQITHKRPLSLTSLSFLVSFFYYFFKHGYFFSTARLDRIKGRALDAAGPHGGEGR
jgi:GT2 family glycosyltransferase